MRKLIIFLTLHFFVVSFSQVNPKKEDVLLLKNKTNKEIDSFSKIDYFKMKFKFIDENFNIKIDSLNFNKALVKYNFYKDRINNFNDSLNVILTYELNSFHGARIASNRITYQWKKVGYYIWENEKKTELISKSFGFDKPYQFYEFLISENTLNQQKNKLLKNLKIKLSKETKDTIEFKQNKQLLMFAFKNNPERLKDMNDYIKKNKKHGH